MKARTIMRIGFVILGPTTYAKYRQKRQFMNIPSVIEIIKVNEGQVEN